MHAKTYYSKHRIGWTCCRFLCYTQSKTCVGNPCVVQQIHPAVGKFYSLHHVAPSLRGGTIRSSSKFGKCPGSNRVKCLKSHHHRQPAEWLQKQWWVRFRFCTPLHVRTILVVEFHQPSGCHYVGDAPRCQVGQKMACASGA